MAEILEILKWQDPYLNNSLAQYVTVFFVVLLTLLVRYFVCSVVYKRLAAWVGSKRDEVDASKLHSIQKPLGYILTLIGVSIAVDILISGHIDANDANDANLHQFIQAFFTTCISLNVAWMCIRFVDILTIYMRNHAAHTESRLDDQLVPLVSKSLKIFIFLVAFAVIVQNLGYSISGILAGLGIGGLALALAAKDTLSNLFGSVTIFLDNPFQVGDWIKVNDTEGVVERVGFRSTNIRTFYKTEISIPNSIIANTTIDNFSRMQRRRISTTIGFTYETSAQQMEDALEALRGVLAKTQGVYQEFYLVNFTGFGESSLDVMLYYFTDTANWQEYLIVRERVNLEIMKAMEVIGVEFAFKSMSVYMRGDKVSLPKPTPVSKTLSKDTSENKKEDKASEPEETSEETSEEKTIKASKSSKSTKTEKGNKEEKTPKAKAEKSSKTSKSGRSKKK